MSNRTCTGCKGTGSYARLSGKVEPCWRCGGKGYFEPLDVRAILDAIVSSVGPTKGRLRKTRPAYKLGARAYYVWRLARFHGGADVCMPVCADMDVSGDPFRKELDALAEAVAKRAFGTNMAAAYRWGSALGYVNRVPAGLPASAYPSGPAGTSIGDLVDSPEFHADRGDETESDEIEEELAAA